MAVGEEGGALHRPLPIVTAATVTAIESLRTAEMPIQVVIHQIAETLSNDAFLGKRYSPSAINDLASYLVAPENMSKPVASVIEAFVATRG